MIVSIDRVCREKLTDEVVGAYVRLNGVSQRVRLADLYKWKKSGCIIENAVLDTRGFIRSKSGKLDVEYVDTLNLKSYANGRSYDGATSKYGITVNDTDYIVKSAKDKLDTSVYSEHIVSTIGKRLGYNTHDTCLYNDNGKVVVLLKDFAVNGYMLRSFKDTAQSSLDSDLSTKDYTYADVVYMIYKHTKLSADTKEKVIAQFWDMFMLDAIFGNRDRHHGNWGYLVKSGVYRLAPIFDNGGSLFPNVLMQFASYFTNKRAFLIERSERFPASLLKQKRVNGEVKRTNYYEYMSLEGQDKHMHEAYMRAKAIAVSRLFDISKSVCYNLYTDKLLSEFYVSIILMRYLHIICRYSLDESYERLVSLWNRK